MMNPATTPSTQKVRRPALGVNRARGHEFQLVRRARRADPRRIRSGKADRNLTGYGGLVDFARFTRSIDFEKHLSAAFADLKLSPWVVYPMGFMMRMMVDLFVMGAARPFELEHAAADPTFRKLAGNLVPSVDVAYDDLRRFDEVHLARLDALVGRQAIEATKPLRLRDANLDIDSTVAPVFGQQVDGAAVGYNPKYRGRPSYHPLLARLAECRVVVGALLRPGNTTFGAEDVPFVCRMIERAKKALLDDATLYVRIDSAGDCAELLLAVHLLKSFFLTKAHQTPDLQMALLTHRAWRTVDRDADGKPTVQIAELDFRRGSWGDAEALPVRVIAVRRTDRERRSPSFLWPEMEWITDVYLTNDLQGDAEDLVERYDHRAGIEPLIGECKTDWNLGAFGIDSFEANAALLNLKVLALNLLRRFASRVAPRQAAWRTVWLRRLLIAIPGRFVRSGRSTTLRLAPRELVVHVA